MPLRHHQPPSDPRMIGDISRRVAVLEREKNPVGFSLTGSLSSRITSESTLWAYWPLTDTSGNAVDLVAARNLTPTAFGGYPIYGQPGPFTLSTDTSIEFSGTNGTSGNGSYFSRTTTSAESTAVFASRHAFSIELLVYPVTAQAAGLFTYAIGTAQSHRLSLTASNQIEFMRSSTDFITGPVLPMTAWTHIVATYDGATMLLYVNGTLVGTLASTTNGATGGQDVELGMYGNSPFSFLKGRLAQVAVYTTALSAATVAQHASAGLAITSLGQDSAFGVQVYDTPGTFTWTKPAGATAVHVVCVGGGGGGGAGGLSDFVGLSGGAGGGGGSVSQALFAAAQVTATVTVTVAAAAAAGTNGGPSSFGSYVSAFGGGAGQSTQNSTSAIGGGGAGTASGASSGNAGTPAAANAVSGIAGQGTQRTGSSGSGVPSEWGGASGGNSPTGGSAPGGDSIFGGRGGGAGAGGPAGAGGAGGGQGYLTGSGAAGGAAGSGGNGTAGTVFAGPFTGTGGGGGGKGTGASVGGNGGAGGIGCGGGGAGNGGNTGTPGTAGAGGRGRVIVITY